MQDRYGNALDTGSATARDAYIEGIDIHLSGGIGAIGLFETAIAEDPNFALAHLAKAVGLYTVGKGRASRKALAKAQECGENLSSFGAGQLGVLSNAMGGKSAAAYDLARSHLVDHPRDPLVADACIGVFSLIGFSGRAGREVENLDLARKLAPAFGDDWFFLAQLAFAQMEAGVMDPAAKNIDRAIELMPRNAHGAHYKSHFYYETGETQAGRAYLADWMADYPKSGLMHGHNSWHQALWALAAGDIDDMWAMIDQDVGPMGSTGPGINILTDTAAVYFRASLAGVEIPDHRWQELSQYATKTFPKPGVAFADAHAAIAHAMAGDGEALAKIIEGARGPAGDMVRNLSEAFGAIARADWATAKERLAPTVVEHERIGGSRAQRDLIEFAFANVLLRLGETDLAGARLAAHRARTEYSGAVVGLHGTH